jgi:(p)ppGpp synthase/HD superfamily hydrolase
MSNHGNRIIKAKWTSQKELAFLAGLRITGTDRVGLMNDVTRVISNELHINMRSVARLTQKTEFLKETFVSTSTILVTSKH